MLNVRISLFQGRAQRMRFWYTAFTIIVIICLVNGYVSEIKFCPKYDYNYNYGGWSFYVTPLCPDTIVTKLMMETDNFIMTNNITGEIIMSEITIPVVNILYATRDCSNNLATTITRVFSYRHNVNVQCVMAYIKTNDISVYMRIQTINDNIFVDPMVNPNPSQTSNGAISYQSFSSKYMTIIPLIVSFFIMFG